MEKQLILVTVSGPDKPGITAKLTQKISANAHFIEDMGQSVTHGLLSLSILIRMNTSNGSHLLKDLLFEAKKLGLALDFEAIEDESLQLKSEQNNRFIISCVHFEKIPSHFIASVAHELSSHNINIIRIDNKSTPDFRALDIVASAPNESSWAALKLKLIHIGKINQTDLAIIKDDVFRYNKRLIVFDMDSTLIQSEVIEEIADYCGVKDEVSKITSLAMNGKINFDESLKQRVALLEGLPQEKLAEIAKNIQLNSGVEKFIKVVKQLGFKTAVISGGFSYFTQIIKVQLGLDYAFANDLEIQNGKLTGRVTGTIINAEQKATLVRLISQQESIDLKQVVAIGDGANDIPMLSIAGMGIAFHAKEIVKEKTQHQMSYGPMTSILSFLGIPENFGE